VHEIYLHWKKPMRPSTVRWKWIQLLQYSASFSFFTIANLIETNSKLFGFLQFINIIVVKIYLEVFNGRQLDVGMGSINSWKKFELEKVTIRKYFLENVLQLMNAN
jgi:hypothetical protein